MSDALELFAAGLGAERGTEEPFDLEREHVRATSRCARRRIDLLPAT